MSNLDGAILRVARRVRSQVRRFSFLLGHLTPATIIGLIALFVALGGSSYAVLKISGSQIKNRSISGKKLKRNTLGRVTINESRLGKVRRARRADRLGGFSAGDLRVHCPVDTTPVSGVCAERDTRPGARYGVARIGCDALGRRLPSYEELANLVSRADISVASPGELTSSVYVSGGQLMIVTVDSDGGAAGNIADARPNGRPFRCVAYPSN
jgi:hypothetical protein